MKKILLLIAAGLLIVGCGSQPNKKGSSNWDPSRDITPKQNGKKHGLVENFDYNGKILRTTTYANGVMNGNDTWYDRRNRKVSAVIPYVNGKKNGLKIKYSYNTRQKSSPLMNYTKTNYVNGQIHGFEKYYIANGNIITSVPYQNGKRSGTSKQWTADGILSNSIQFKNDKRNGTEKKYDVYTGQLVETIIWSNGVVKKRYYSATTKRKIAQNKRYDKEFNKEYEKERKMGKYAMPSSKSTTSYISSNKGRTQITKNDGRFIGGVCSNGNTFFIEKKSLLYEGSGAAVCTGADLQRTISCVCAGV